MNGYPRISIITPCFNHEEYIAQTIESVISQGYPNLQYIVIDDGSTDNSRKVIEQYQKELSSYLKLDDYRPSPVWAINQGFAESDGEILYWISSDDILLPKSLFTVAKVFSDLPEVEWITGLASTINKRGELVNCKTRPKNHLDYLIGDWQVIQQESTFFRRSLWERAGNGLNEGFLQAFDTELWTRFFLEAKHYELQSPLGAFRKGMQSRSVRNINEFLAYNDKALERMRGCTSSEEKFRSSVYKVLRTYFLRNLLRLIPERLSMESPLKQFSDSWIHYNFRWDRFEIKEGSVFHR